MTNCRLDDPVFERGIKDFLAVCNVVKTFRNIRILQIGPRPYDFWSTMCNEGELLEKFNIQLAPIPMPELTEAVAEAKAEKTEVDKAVAYIRSHMDVRIKDDEVENVAGLYVAMKGLMENTAVMPVPSSVGTPSRVNSASCPVQPMPCSMK